MKNIVLIGMPGAGKSTLGVLLAKALGMDFLDTDVLIQNLTKRKLSDIIKYDGIEIFTIIENEFLYDIETEGTVISTGGSAVYCEEGMESLKENGIVVYIKLPYKEIENRISDIKTRGIAMSDDETLLDVYNKRIPLYEKYADIIFEAEGKNIEQSVKEICELLKNELA